MRWRGFFKLKPEYQNSGNRTRLGNPGVFANEPEHDVDQAMKKEIDIEGMRNMAGDRARIVYEGVEGLFGGKIPKLDFTWKSMWENPELNALDRDAKLFMYNAQDGIKEYEALKKILHKKETKSAAEERICWDGIDDFQVTKEQFVTSARNNAFMTFAVVYKGEWHERGSMGWWGCVSDEKDPGAWEKEFNGLIDTLPDDTMLTLYDCHI